MELSAITALVTEDLGAVDAFIRKRLSSDVALINELANHIVAGGGKRLRPIIVLLAARTAGYTGDEHIHLAAVVEFIHTATLLHDDVVDGSERRRGSKTANALWGNAPSVLVGDFLYSRAFQMMVEINQMRIMDILANATNTIAEGEVQQLLNVHDPDTTEARYLQVIHDKTAKLFESATQLAAILSQQPAEVENAIANYGMHLGTAFQLIDDVLDYSDSSGEIGKNVGDDLAEGKPTLPLIFTMRNGTPEQNSLMRDVIEHGGRERFDEVKHALTEVGAIAYTEQTARSEADKAIVSLSVLPDTIYKEALCALAEFSVNRTY